MSNASVEISWLDLSRQIYGDCVRCEALAISDTTATLATPIGASDPSPVVARIATDDTGCWFAKGQVPDPTATVATENTTAGRWLPAGGDFVVHLVPGDKIAVHS